MMVQFYVSIQIVSQRKHQAKKRKDKFLIRVIASDPRYIDYQIRSLKTTFSQHHKYLGNLSTFLFYAEYRGNSDRNLSRYIHQFSLILFLHLIEFPNVHESEPEMNKGKLPRLLQRITER